MYDCLFSQEINNPDLDFIQNDEEDEETWKEKDRPLFQPCLGLIKVLFVSIFQILFK